MQLKFSFCWGSLACFILLVLTGGVREARAQVPPLSSGFIDPQFREELSAELDALDDQLATLREFTDEKLSQPAKFARACLLLAVEFIHEKDIIGETAAAARAKRAIEVALFLLKGYEVDDDVFATKCLSLQDPETGDMGFFVGKGSGNESPHLDLKGIEDVKVELEVLFKEEILNQIDEGMRRGQIKGEELISEIRTELSKIAFTRCMDSPLLCPVLAPGAAEIFVMNADGSNQA